MSNPDLGSKKSKKLYVVILAVVLIIIIVGAAAFYLGSNGTSTSSSKTPTLSSMAGTYVEQTSSGTGYNIVLYENGTALFSTYPGTWHIDNSTTFDGTYTVLFAARTDYFTITNNGFTAVSTGNVYVKK
ncbi:MAG: hypothetical protein ABSA79_02955 [Candidatus Bathyarchaeia archaeon]|jgi:hypothetical protein